MSATPNRCRQKRRLLDAWALFHNGEFQKAMEAGLKLGLSGLTLAHKSACIYATYLEQREKTRLELYHEVAERAEAHAAQDPGNPNAHYWHAYALGRYSQGISVAKALAQGWARGSRLLSSAPSRCSRAMPTAHIALGAFHAEVIDKVGSLIGSMTYGARKDVGLNLFQEAMRINLESALAMVEYANALLMLEGDQKLKEATRLYQQAAAFKPFDAAERLDVELARAELED